MKSRNRSIISMLVFLSSCAVGATDINRLCTADDQANGTCPPGSSPPSSPPPSHPTGCGTPVHEPSFSATVLSSEPTIARIDLAQFNAHQSWVASVADWIYCTSGIAIQ